MQWHNTKYGWWELDENLIVCEYPDLLIYIYYLSYRYSYIIFVYRDLYHQISLLYTKYHYYQYYTEYSYSVYYIHTLYSTPSQSSRSACFPNRLSVGGRWNGKWGPPNRRLVDHRPMDQSASVYPPARFSAFPGWELHHDWYYHTVSIVLCTYVLHCMVSPSRAHRRINFARPKLCFFCCSSFAFLFVRWL